MRGRFRPGSKRTVLDVERNQSRDRFTDRYDNHPLYFYAHEGKREVKCHDVFMNGGNWYVVRPDGDPGPPV